MLCIRTLVLYLLVGIALPAGTQAKPATAATGESERLRANVIALDKVQKNILRTLKNGRDAQSLPIKEENELLIFVDYLLQQNRDYCMQLQKQAGSAALIDLPCPDEPVQLPTGNARTTDEELTDLDQQLNASLGEFDEMLLKEEQRIASHQQRQRESGGSGSSGGFGGQQGQAGNQAGDTADSSKAGQQGENSAAGQHNQKKTSGVAGSESDNQSSGKGTSATGTQGVSGSNKKGGAGSDRLHRDDDIVARQLREAAEKETDPELREKLWQEYRKYKEGL